MRMRFVVRGGGESAFENHTQYVGRIGVGYGRVAGQRWIAGGLAASVAAMTGRAVFGVGAESGFGIGRRVGTGLRGRGGHGLVLRLGIFEVVGDRMQILVGEELQAAMYHLAHRSGGDGVVRRLPGLEEGLQRFEAPASDAVVRVGGDVRRTPLLDHAAAQSLVVLLGTEQIAW